MLKLQPHFMISRIFEVHFSYLCKLFTNVKYWNKEWIKTLTLMFKWMLSQYSYKLKAISYWQSTMLLMRKCKRVVWYSILLNHVCTSQYSSFDYYYYWIFHLEFCIWDTIPKYFIVLIVSTFLTCCIFF